MARYKQLLYYAKKLPPMPQEEKVEVNKVKGCVSQASTQSQTPYSYGMSNQKIAITPWSFP